MRRRRRSRWRDTRPRPRQHSRSPWIALLLLVALAVTLGGIFPFRQILAQDRQVDNTRAKLDAFVAENDGLEDRIAALETPVELERIAREEYGMVRPGEMGYTVTSPGDDAPPVDVTVPPETTNPDERSFTEKLWDFLTGRDIEPDE